MRDLRSARQRAPRLQRPSPGGSLGAARLIGSSSPAIATPAAEAGRARSQAPAFGGGVDGLARPVEHHHASQRPSRQEVR
eukprot:1373013-Pyramimonas_sp.AAC.1